MTESDYVIVGAGSAGCALAGRLLERGASVTLIEAGGSDRGLRFTAPALFPLVQDSDADWGYRTEPQQGLEGRVIFWPRGRVLGGSSTINAMIYIRGHASDYDAWADAGCVGWSSVDVAPLFRRMEAHRRLENEHHGVEGPVSVEDLRSPLPCSTAFVQAAATCLGVPADHDFNGASQEGAGLFHRTCRDGRRESAHTAYLRGRDHGGRLRLVTNVLARQVVFANGRATGVQVTRGREATVHGAAREVVLCAGAIGSPQLLMLSGIGPADELRALGLTVRVDAREVGRNLQDHPIVPVSFALRRPEDALALGPFTVIGRTLGWYLGRRDLLATNHAEAGAFFRSTPSEPIPDLQLHMGPWGAAGFEPNGKPLDPPKGPHLSIQPTLLRPKSRGTVRLASADHDRHPRIDPNYLAEPDDLARLVRGVECARDIAATEPLASMIREAAGPVATAADGREVEAAVRRMLTTIFHPVGTCRMGADDASVCTPDLRVRGVDGLRVADASIMPTIVGGNTNAPAMMIGEWLADAMAR